METSVAPTVMWVLLGNNVWWPVEAIHGNVISDFTQSSTRLGLVRIMGLATEITVDMQDSTSIRYLEPGSAAFSKLCSAQPIPGRLREQFRQSIVAVRSVRVIGDADIDSAGPALCSSISPKASTYKRSDVISWDDYFMAVAFLSSLRSKDPSTQVGACIVNADQRIVGIGYNGFPRGCSDDVLPWARQAEDPLETKYPFVCHAEMNAILNKNSADVYSCKIYVALFPCNECAKMIIQSGIKEVVYVSDKHHTSMSAKASRVLLNMANVTVRKFVPRAREISIDFMSIK